MLHFYLWKTMLIPCWIFVGLLTLRMTRKNVNAEGEQYPFLNLFAVLFGPLLLGFYVSIHYIHRWHAQKKADEWKDIDTGVTLLREDGTEINPAPEHRAEVESRKRFFDLVESAVKADASRVYITPDEDGDYSVDFRVNGINEHKSDIDCLTGGALCSAFKKFSGMSVEERRFNQNGTLIVRSAGEERRCRISSSRSFGGEKITLRLSDDYVVPPLESLGMDAAQLELLGGRLAASGLIIFCGPSGCGKSTTMRSVLTCAQMSANTRIFIENPIGMKLEGVTQIEENPQEGRNSRRIMINETAEGGYNVIAVEPVADAEGAKTAIAAAKSGRLVLAGVDCNDFNGALVKFNEWGVALSALSEVLTLVVNQRLLRTVDGRSVAVFDLIPHDNFYEVISDAKATMQSVRKALGGMLGDGELQARVQALAESGAVTAEEAQRVMVSQ